VLARADEPRVVESEPAARRRRAERLVRAVREARVPGTHLGERRRSTVREHLEETAGPLVVIPEVSLEQQRPGWGVWHVT
jgi:hypothetical protein